MTDPAPFSRLIIKSKNIGAIKRRHPWVFSGAIAKTEGEPGDGDLVEVYDFSDNYLGCGHFQKGSIMVRLLVFAPEKHEQDFWSQRLQRALSLRRSLGLLGHSHTNCFRLVHGEGDGLPGLIIDMYDKLAVVQCHSIGMHRALPDITSALKEVFGEKLQSVYNKSKRSLPSAYAAGMEDGFLFGDAGPEEVLENGHRFLVDWETGQKTGFFLDQRENRQTLAFHAAGQSVLNTFCYTGGFSVYALQAGAKLVDSVDSSATAMDITDKNVALTHDADRHRSFTAEVLPFLKGVSQSYDIIVVDPPAFAKDPRSRHKAVQAYKRLNVLAIRKVNPGGLLFTFSCSQVVDRQLFYNTMVAAGLESNRSLRVLRHLSQPPDHPVSLFHPEGEYLKGLVVQVE